MAGNYRRVVVVEDAKPFHDTEPEAEFWKQFSGRLHVQQPAAVTSVDFSPVAPHDVAVTASARVGVLDGVTLEARHAITKFRGQAFSGRFRGDGRLIVAGGEEGVVRVFDATSRAELRTFRGHAAAVRCARFARDRVTVVSAGDDGSVREHDLTTGECTALIPRAHGDHVRALECSPASAGIWASGGYDGRVRVWDVGRCRPSPAAEGGGVVATLDHGAPVEAVIFFGGGNALASAGGGYVRVWDLLAGGRVIAEMANHQKTVTALALDASGTRLLSGGADRLVKVYDVQSYRVVHTMVHHAAVLALAVSPEDGRRLAIGAADGDLCILSRREDRSEEAAAEAERERRHGRRARGSLGTVRYFLRGHEGGGGDDDQERRDARKTKKKGENAVEQYDRLLRQFKYKAALDAALDTKRPGTIVGLLRELIHRGGLGIALGGRDETTLEPLLVFLVNYVVAPQYSSLLVTVCRAIIDMYASTLGRSMRVDELFFKLQTRLHREIELQYHLLRLMGALDLLVASSEAPLSPAPQQPSEDVATPDASVQQQQQQQQQQQEVE